MRNDYLKTASAIIKDPNILINVVSKRVKQLRAGSRPLVNSLEKLEPEDIALKEIIEGKITYELFSSEPISGGGVPVANMRGGGVPREFPEPMRSRGL
jgi:DNA-directed RNA polymerase subunit omega